MGQSFLSFANKYLAPKNLTVPIGIVKPLEAVKANLTDLKVTAAELSKTVDEITDTILPWIGKLFPGRQYPDEQGTFPIPMIREQWLSEDMKVLEGFFQAVHPIVANYISLSNCLDRSTGVEIFSKSTKTMEELTVFMTRNHIKEFNRGLTLFNDQLYSKSNQWTTRYVYTSLYYFMVGRT